MSYVIDGPRLCLVCKEPVTDNTTAGYVTKSGMAMVGHLACLEGLSEAIVERRSKAIRKSQYQPQTVPLHAASNETQPLKKHLQHEGNPFNTTSDGEVVTKQDALDFIKLMSKVFKEDE